MRRRCTFPGRSATAPTWCASPCTNQAKSSATRIELRSPDPACNPYLAFSVMLAAGLRGIEEKLECPAPREIDIFQLTQEERDEMGITSLPGSLIRRIDLCEQSELVREALGDHVFREFIANKRAGMGSLSHLYHRLRDQRISATAVRGLRIEV